MENSDENRTGFFRIRFIRIGAGAYKIKGAKELCDTANDEVAEILA